MNWIKIEDREPQEGQLVLVKGTRETELNDTTENQIGLVDYFKPSYSIVKDSCGLDIIYTKITEWCEVTE